MTAHHCHAVGCQVETPAWKLMCDRHWRMVPAPLKRDVLANFRPGQVVDKKPSKAWIAAATAAIAAVQRREGPQQLELPKPQLGLFPTKGGA